MSGMSEGKLETRKVVKVLVASVSNSFVTPWTVARQAPLSMGFSRQEYWSGLPCPLPGIFLTQESNLRLLQFLHCRWTLHH